MSGKSGMKIRETSQDTGRARMWRIIRRRMVFTLDDIVIPLDGVTQVNAWKFISNLLNHGFIRFDRWNGKQGQRGSCKVYRLAYNPGPHLPTTCPNCNKSITARTCGGEA